MKRYRKIASRRGAAQNAAESKGEKKGQILIEKYRELYKQTKRGERLDTLHSTHNEIVCRQNNTYLTH